MKWVVISFAILAFVCGCAEDKTKVLIEKPTPVEIDVQVPEQIAIKQPIEVRQPVNVTVVDPFARITVTVNSIWWGRGSVWGKERLYIGGFITNHTDSDVKVSDIEFRVNGKVIDIVAHIVPDLIEAGDTRQFELGTEDTDFQERIKYSLKFTFKDALTGVKILED